MKKKYDILYVVSLLFIILIALFNKVLFGDSNFVSGDTLAPQAFKQSIENIKNIYKVDYNYWFPYIFSGMPSIHSFIGSTDYYLPQKFFLFFKDFGMPWVWNFILHYLFGGVGMFLLLKYLKQNLYVSFFGSSLFMISPYMIAYFVHGHGSQVMSALYIPWIILFLFRKYDDPNLINFSLLALFIGLQLQRGHVQIAYYTWMLIGLYLLIKFIFNIKNNSNINFINKYLLIISSMILGLIFSMNIYLPALKYSDNSVRADSVGGYGIEQATSWSLHYNEFITFFMPYFYGFGGKSYYGFFQFTDFANYFGIIVIYLAIIGLLKSKLKKDYKLFFSFSILLSLIFATGKYNLFFYEFFYNYLPFFNKFRVPVYFLIITYFSIIILASIGLAVLISSKNKYVYKQFILVSSFILLFLFANKFFDRQENYINKMIGKETNINFLSIEENLNNIINPILISNSSRNSDWIGLKKKIIKDKRKTLHLYSYVVKDHNNDGKINQIDFNKIIFANLYSEMNKVNTMIDNLDSSFNRDLNFQIFIILILLLSFILFYKISLNNNIMFMIFIFILIFDYIRIDYDIIYQKYHQPHKEVLKDNSYLQNFLNSDSLIQYLNDQNNFFNEPYRIIDLTQSNPNRWAAFNIENINGYHPAKLSSYNKLLSAKNPFNYNLNNLNLLNVKYIISENILSNNYKKLKMNYFGRKQWIDNQKIDIYLHEIENKPRYFFINDINLYNSEKEDINIYNLITSSSFNPKENSLIDVSDLKKNELEIIEKIKYDSNATVDIEYWSPDKIILNTKSESNQLLFLSEIFYPGWKTNLDYEILKINGLFKGLIVPSGDNRIIIEFDPIDIIIGKLLNMISAFLIIVLIVIGINNRRKHV